MNFDELKMKAGQVLETVANAANRAASSAKTSVSICAEEEKIKTAYQMLGKLYYSDQKAGLAPGGAAYAEQIAKIEASFARIQELREQNSTEPVENVAEETVTEADFAD